jgi:hypothetical protein
MNSSNYSKKRKVRQVDEQIVEQKGSGDTTLGLGADDRTFGRSRETQDGEGRWVRTV